MTSLFDLDKSGKLVGRSIKIHKYDPYQYPPNFQLAEDHLIATRIAVPTEIQGIIDVDEATGLPVKNEKIPLCCDEDELNFLSPGYPMYFQFVKFCLSTMLVMFLISGVYNLYNNYNGTSCYTIATLPRPVRYSFLREHCLKSFITQFTLANIVDDEKSKDTQELMNLLTVIVMIVYLQYLRRQQRVKAILCDERATTPSDYTIRVQNLPRENKSMVDVDDEVKAWFELNGLPGKKLEIRRVNLCFDVEPKLEVVDQIEEKSLIVADLQHQKMEGKLVSDDEIEKLTREIDEKEKELTKINREYRSGITNKFIGECYITFNHNEEMINVVNHWKMGRTKRLQEEYNANSQYKYKGNLLRVQRASEPSDIFWENAGYTARDKLIRRILTAFGTFAVILVSFYLVYLCKQQKNRVIDEFASKKNKGATDVVAIRFFSNLGAIIIIFLNSALATVMEKMAHYEKYSTLSDHEAQLAYKLTLAQWFNTTIVFLILALQNGNLWGPGGLTLGIYYVFQNNAILPIIFAIIDWGYLTSMVKRIYLRFKSPNVKMTQKQLNEAFEFPQFEFAERYAYYIKTLCSAAFYAPLVPGCQIWGLIGMGVKYWLDKTIMLRKRSRGSSISPELPSEFMELLELPIIAFAAGNLFFGLYAEDFDIWELIPSIFGLILGIANAVLPMKKINEKLFDAGYVKLIEETYDEKRLDFFEDYDRANPATGDVALERYVKEKQGVRTEMSILKSRINQKFAFDYIQQAN